jgi:hypothetical protein
MVLPVSIWGLGISHTSDSRSLTQECYNIEAKFQVTDRRISSTLA